jgi:hypothetical protein
MKEYFVVVNWEDGKQGTFPHITSIDMTGRLIALRDRDGCSYHINPDRVWLISVNGN